MTTKSLVKNGIAVLLGDCSAILWRPLTTDRRRCGRLESASLPSFWRNRKNGAAMLASHVAVSGLKKIIIEWQEV